MSVSEGPCGAFRDGVRQTMEQALPVELAMQTSSFSIFLGAVVVKNVCMLHNVWRKSVTEVDFGHLPSQQALKEPRNPRWTF